MSMLVIHGLYGYMLTDFIEIIFYNSKMKIRLSYSKYSVSISQKLVVASPL